MPAKKAQLIMNERIAQRAREKRKGKEKKRLTAIKIQYGAAVMKSTTTPDSDVSLDIFVDKIQNCLLKSTAVNLRRLPRSGEKDSTK